MKSKYNGIDERDIKCCSDNPNSIEGGISFEEYDGKHILRFHFLDFIDDKVLTQLTKSMILNKENTDQLILHLKKLNFKLK